MPPCLAPAGEREVRRAGAQEEVPEDKPGRRPERRPDRKPKSKVVIDENDKNAPPMVTVPGAKIEKKEENK